MPMAEERHRVLRAVFPLLPLRQHRALFTRTGRGLGVEPWLQHHLTFSNSDESGNIAKLLGTTRHCVFAQLEDFEGLSTVLDTREALAGLPGADRVLTAQQFDKHIRSEDRPTTLWWYLMLPVLTPSREVAFVQATLSGRFGAEDFWWLAKKNNDAWSIESLKVTW